MCRESWRGGGVPRSPSHESVTTDLSLFSVSSAASDAKMLRLLACKAGQGPDPSLRVASPNPDSRCLNKRPSSTLPLQPVDNCRELLAGCAALCSALGLRRCFSCGDLATELDTLTLRNATSEVCLRAALEASRLSASEARSGSTWCGSQLPSPHNKQVRQNYIRKRLISTYRALERMSQSEFNLDKLEAAAVSAGAGQKTLTVPNQPRPFVHPEAAHLALTAADLERERGRPLSKYERNMMIFNWLHTLDDSRPF